MDSKNKKVLLHLEDAKMHFPVKKQGVFNRETLAVRAVDGVTIDIFQGETLGLVGESGCGKSTLGRLVLQLYKPTAGKVFYFGVTLDDYAPAYVKGIIAKLSSIQEKDANILLQKAPDAVTLVGGLLLSSDLSAVSNLYHKRTNAAARLHKALVELELHTFKLSALEPSAWSDKQKRHHKVLEDTVSREREQVKEANDAINAERAKVSSNVQNSSADVKSGFDLLESKRSIGIDLSLLTNKEMRKLRRYLQIVFQDPYSSLNPRLTVGTLISEALVEHKIFSVGTDELDEYTLKVMEDCGLQKYMLHRYPHQFSGGQRQRIGIARALALKPSFVVCDEAVSALDVSIQSQVINLLIDLKEQHELTYLFISHDLSTVKFISDRVCVMYLGNIIELGESNDIYEEPLHHYTKALLEAIPTTVENSNKELKVLEGDIPSPITPPSGCKFHTRCPHVADICKKECPAFRELKPNHFVACHFPVQKK